MSVGPFATFRKVESKIMPFTTITTKPLTKMRKRNQVNLKVLLKGWLKFNPVFLIKSMQLLFRRIKPTVFLFYVNNNHIKYMKM